MAISAADGYARMTGKPQCVLVHVDVGTAALGQGLQNASSGKAPVLIVAGQAPVTCNGELPGSRSEHVQWYQDVKTQHSIVAPYSRYSNEIRCAEHLQTMLDRTILMATTGCPGPTYLTAGREVLAAKTAIIPRANNARPSCYLGGLSSEAVNLITKALLAAEKPLIITGYLGRSHQAVRSLVDLTNLLWISVFDSEFRELSFPADHPAWLTRSTGAAHAIREADVILVLDADVPWIPTKVRPSKTAKIYHVDLDPRKEQMNLFDLEATATYHASCGLALAQILESVQPHLQSSDVRERINTRRLYIHERSQAGHNTLKRLAEPSQSGLLSKELLFKSLRRLVPSNTIYVSDAVTNQGSLQEQLQLTEMGTNLTKGASGLGWAGGAALGVKLAAQKYNLEDRPNVLRRDKKDELPLVCMIIGDGAFTFSSPTAVYNAAHRLSLPFLSIVLNNGGWKATRSCLNDVHPDGLAAKLTDAQIGIDLKDDGPDYGGIAKAASAGRLWTRKVCMSDEIESTIQEAVELVSKGEMGALIDACICN